MIFQDVFKILQGHDHRFRGGYSWFHHETPNLSLANFLKPFKHFFTCVRTLPCDPLPSPLYAFVRIYMTPSPLPSCVRTKWMVPKLVVSLSVCPVRVKTIVCVHSWINAEPVLLTFWRFWRCFTFSLCSMGCEAHRCPPGRTSRSFAHRWINIRWRTGPKTDVP